MRKEMNAVIYEIDTGIVLACGDVVVDKENKSVHTKENNAIIRGGNFDVKIAVVDSADIDITGVEPLSWRYLPATRTFERIEGAEIMIPKGEE
jgi:hypothetical protein